MNKLILVMGMLTSVSFLCACAGASDRESDTANQEVYASNVITLGLEPELDYEVPNLRPHILIDDEGYATGGKKVLFVTGKNLNSAFSLINIDSGETIYEGNLSLVTENYSEKGDLYIGEFTEIYAPGEYRVFQSEVGYSYDFEIKDNIYKDLYRELYDCLQHISTDDNSENCYRVATLMFAHEIYPNAYTNKKYLRSQIENLLLQQDEKTKNIYAHVQTQQSIDKAVGTSEKDLKDGSEPEISLSATAEFAGVMANYYHDFYEDDTEFATLCLQAATQAYVSMVKYRDNVPTDAWYYAAASLYRATGNENYKNAISEYDSLNSRSRTASTLDYRMLADMAYLNTEYRADYTRCEEIMHEYKNRAMQIVDSTSRQSMYVREDAEDANEQDMLTDMMVLGIVDYVLSGREYSSVQENYLHYFFGRNKDVINRLKEGGAGQDKEIRFTDSIQTLSKLIYILGYDDKIE